MIDLEVSFRSFLLPLVLQFSRGVSMKVNPSPSTIKIITLFQVYAVDLNTSHRVTQSD